MYLYASVIVHVCVVCFVTELLRAIVNVFVCSLFLSLLFVADLHAYVHACVRGWLVWGYEVNWDPYKIIC